MKTREFEEMFDGHPIAVRCPVKTCSEVLIIPYYPLEYRLRCLVTDDCVDISITLEGEVQVIHHKSKYNNLYVSELKMRQLHEK